MMDDTLSELRSLTRDLNSVARSVIAEDGAHAAMFFLRVEGGELAAHLFAEAVERRVGEARGREIAEAVRSTGADAVVCVSEAWSAAPEAVPEEDGVGDAPDAHDVLLVAAVDRHGNSVALETPVVRLPDGTVELGASEEYEGDYSLNFLEPVKAAWERDLLDSASSGERDTL